MHKVINDRSKKALKDFQMPKFVAS
ncbi:hypothetical protein FG475_11990 [Vibrio navarrensis]|nr:hypothetical protein [Vibrio navarrensis]